MPKTTDVDDLLSAEYSSLLTLYTHTENTIINVFNFYLTLLSAVAGAIIVLIQINVDNLDQSLPSISLLLIIAILIGIITQDAIVNKNIDLAKYTLGLNLLKHRLFKQAPEEKAYVFYLQNFWSDVNPLKPKKLHRSDKVHQRLWLFFPLGTHQLFISVIDSFMLAALVVIVAELLSSDDITTLRLIIGGVIMCITSIQVHFIYARMKHRRGMETIVTAAGKPVDWS